MKELFAYNTKDYRDRNQSVEVLTALSKANIAYERKNAYANKVIIRVKANQLEKAQEVLAQVKAKQIERRGQFLKAIKLAECEGNMRKFSVDSLYNRLAKRFAGSIYLPDSWRGGKAIQNYSQNDFWSFQFRNIVGAKELKGVHVIVTTLSNRKVWILPVKFQSSINGYFEDMQLAGTPILDMDSLLDTLAVKSFSGEEWNQLLADKKIIYTGVWRSNK